MSECLHIRKFLYKNREWVCKDCEQSVNTTERDKFLKELDCIDDKLVRDTIEALHNGDADRVSLCASRLSNKIKDEVRKKYDFYRFMPTNPTGGLSEK